MSGIDLMRGRGKVEGASGRVGNGYSVGNAFVETQGGQRVRECVRCELAWDGARGFEFGKGCSGVVLMTRDGCRQVRTGRTGVGMVTVMTRTSLTRCILVCPFSPSIYLYVPYVSSSVTCRQES